MKTQLLASLGLPLMLMLSLSGCEETAEHGGLPACEPPSELVFERSLKEGFRAISEERWDQARSAFERVLAAEPGHPEARAGLRLVTRLPKNSNTQRPVGGLVMGEHELATQLSIDHSSMRLELRAEERRLAKEIQRNKKHKTLRFERRRSKGKTSLSGIDLVVLHTTDTLSALESFVRAQYAPPTTHFMIDWDGKIYQTLDLERIARHTGVPELDRRSVSLSLVAPRSASSPPLPKSAKEVERPMSQRVRIQGKLIRSWGYTRAQQESLRRLIADLTRLLPDLTLRLPGGQSVTMNALSPEERSKVQGIVGLLHLDPASTDPGPGFDWTSLR